jgi:hypothetical protein
MTAEFKSSASRLDGELEARIEAGKRRLAYHNSFLDDYLRGIGPRDLIVIGAPEGVGKTQLSFTIGAESAKHGRHVFMFALEAEERELEWRRKFAILAELVYRAKHPRAHEFNFDDWSFGDQEDIAAEFNDEANARLRGELATLHTLYRETHFGPTDVTRELLKIRHKAQLVIIDHLHYIDNDADDEHRATGELVKLIRDIQLSDLGKPIILVAHLRKRDQRAKKIFVDSHDFHGSGNIGKVCTQMIALQPALDIKPKHWSLAPTYFQILKGRRGGRCPLVAVMNFDLRTKLYERTYSLGRSAQGGTRWDPLKLSDNVPFWAARNGNHRPWDTSNSEPSAQASLTMPPTDDVPHASTQTRFPEGST